MPAESTSYDSISPSAAFLIQLKAYSTIPFAREAAAILERVNPSMADYIRQMGVRGLFRWLVHFENRYRTIEDFLEEIKPERVLEISSGYSFRGMDWCRRHHLHFIDTDLPALIQTKKQLLQAISPKTEMPGKLELMPLNAVDEEQFRSVANRFDPGPLTVVNEGLLVYLDREEKKTLCHLVRDILIAKGGEWISGDIYIKRTTDDQDLLSQNEYSRRFREQHHIEENKFESFEAAEAFFSECGFALLARKQWSIEDSSCLQYLPESDRPGAIEKLVRREPDRETWLLRPA